MSRAPGPLRWRLWAWCVCFLLGASLAAGGVRGQTGPGPEDLLLQVDEARASCDWVFRADLTHRSRGFDRVWKLRVVWAAWEGSSASVVTVLDPPSFRGTSRLVLEDHGPAPDRVWVLLSLERGDVLPVGRHLHGEGLLVPAFSHHDEQRWIAPEHYQLRRLPGEQDDPPGTIAVEGRLEEGRRVDLGYSRVVWWVDPGRREIVRMRFFGADGRPLKELEVLDWREPEAPGGCRLPRRQRMTHLETGARSELVLVDVEQAPRFGNRDFVPDRLPELARRLLQGRVETGGDGQAAPPLRGVDMSAGSWAARGAESLHLLAPCLSPYDLAERFLHGLSHGGSGEDALDPSQQILVGFRSSSRSMRILRCFSGLVAKEYWGVANYLARRPDMEVTLDRFGRIVIPKRVREGLGLKAGTVLEIEEGDEELVLSVRREEPDLVREDGVLVYTGEAVGELEKAEDSGLEGPGF